MSIRVEGLSHTCPRRVIKGKPLSRRHICPGRQVCRHRREGRIRENSAAGTLERADPADLPAGFPLWEPSCERDRNELRQLVGMVFQYPEQQLFAENVYREIAYGLTCAGINAAEIDQRVRESLQLVGVGKGTPSRSPFELSGGQKRRVAMAGVLAMRPEILLLDEPIRLDTAGAPGNSGFYREYTPGARAHAGFGIAQSGRYCPSGRPGGSSDKRHCSTSGEHACSVPGCSCPCRRRSGTAADYGIHEQPQRTAA